ncbi:MAG: ADP-ribosylglycohydrolase family protein [Lachnospiraceae bacterium]|nr:ADP-ribosylglycohydrolase family protein [Lachnospiraceae bacterium]
MRRRQNLEKAVRAAWEAFAVGDAMGMPTEFMRPEDIREMLKDLPFDARHAVLTPSEHSYTHGDLPTGTVTDDTEQNLYLLAEIRRRGGVTLEGTLTALNDWIRETDAVAKHYIGPSSLKALKAIGDGKPAAQAGMGGTTCGGIMRTPSAVLWNPLQSEEELEEAIVTSLLPTHNTSEALEAAGAYGFALLAAVQGKSYEEIMAAALRGGEKLIRRAPYLSCAPSSVRRIRRGEALAEEAGVIGTPSLLRDTLFQEWGTGLPSADVCGAVFALFSLYRKKTWAAIIEAATLGGDTDTIAALVGALCAAHAGKSDVPESVKEKVAAVNRPLFEAKYPEALA